MDVRVATLDSAKDIVIKDADQEALCFFRHDPSSHRPGSYDEWIVSGKSPLNSIVDEDIMRINATMTTRAQHALWKPFTESSTPLSALADIPVDWDLVTMSDSDWHYLGVLPHAEAVLATL